MSSRKKENQKLCYEDIPEDLKQLLIPFKENRRTKGSVTYISEQKQLSFKENIKEKEFFELFNDDVDSIYRCISEGQEKVIRKRILQQQKEEKLQKRDVELGETLEQLEKYVDQAEEILELLFQRSNLEYQKFNEELLQDSEEESEIEEEYNENQKKMKIENISKK